MYRCCRILQIISRGNIGSLQAGKTVYLDARVLENAAQNALDLEIPGVIE